jgi:hypothetical protein
MGTAINLAAVANTRVQAPDWTARPVALGRRSQLS